MKIKWLRYVCEGLLVYGVSFATLACVVNFFATPENSDRIGMLVFFLWIPLGSIALVLLHVLRALRKRS
jgi:hypothetical protein